MQDASRYESCIFKKTFTVLLLWLNSEARGKHLNIIFKRQLIDISDILETFFALSIRCMVLHFSGFFCLWDLGVVVATLFQSANDEPICSLYLTLDWDMSRHGISNSVLKLGLYLLLAPNYKHFEHFSNCK